MADPGNQPERLISPAWLASLLLGGAIALGAAWLRLGMIGSDQFPINWLDVEGDLNRTTVAQVRAAVAPQAAHGFFAVSMAEARAAIEGLPWIAEVEISRHWPDSLSVRVVEHRALARWNEIALVSETGEIFDVAGTSGMQGLPRLTGPESRRREVFETWLDMRRRLNPAGLDIEAVHLDPRGAWQLELNSGVAVLLGREKMDQRLDRLVAVYDRLMRLDERISRVDLRYTNGLAVTRYDPEAIAELEIDGDRDHG